MVDIVKLNFKAGLFSLTFKFQHSFLAKSPFLVYMGIYMGKTSKKIKVAEKYFPISET